MLAGGEKGGGTQFCINWKSSFLQVKRSYFNLVLLLNKTLAASYTFLLILM